MTQYRYVLFVILSACLTQGYAQKNPDIVFLNGRIWTAHDQATFAEALAIRGSKITHVGSTKEVTLLAGSSTRVIDLKGKLVIPGFNDAHIHFLGGALGLSEVDLISALTPEEVVSRVADFARNNPSIKWIRGRGWQYSIFPSGLPSADALKGMITDRPVLLTAYDGHSAWANKRALELAGITGQRKDASYGEVVLDKEGTPTGALLEEAQSLVSRLVPAPTREEKLEALRRGLKMAAALGITSLQNASGSEDELSLYLALLQGKELTVRYAAAFSVDAQTTEKEIVNYDRIRKKLGVGNAMLTANAVKFMLDGVIESHTAAMLSPYSDVNDNGNLALPVARYNKLVTDFDKKGFRIYTHAIGDRAVREALSAYENAQKENGPRSRRHRVEHIETISPEDIPRFFKLGVIASMQPIHADPGTMAVWSGAIGEKRLPYSFAWTSLLNAKAGLVFSSDWPACIDINPLHGIHIAVSRRTHAGYPADGWVVEQKVSIGNALLAYTKAGAYSSFEEPTKGEIKPGYLADVIVLSADLFQIDPMKIFEAHVVLTVFDGKIIYQSEKF